MRLRVWAIFIVTVGLPAVAAVLNERTPKQQERMAREFESLRGKLQELAATATAGTPAPQVGRSEKARKRSMTSPG